MAERNAATSIHVHSTCVNEAPAGGFVRNADAMASDIPHDAAIEPAPIAATALRGRRGPNTESKRALPKGIAGTSHNHRNIFTLSFLRRGLRRETGAHGRSARSERDQPTLL